MTSSKWKHFPRYWPFVRGIHRSRGEFPAQRPVTRALMFSLICARINGWVNSREAGDLRRHRPHYDVTVMYMLRICFKDCMCFVRFSGRNLATLPRDTISTYFIHEIFFYLIKSTERNFHLPKCHLKPNKSGRLSGYRLLRRRFEKSPVTTTRSIWRNSKRRCKWKR